MKKLILLMLVFTLAIGVLPSQAATKAKAKAKAPKPIQGKVVSLNDIAIGSFQNWKKADAEAAAAKGAATFVLLSGTGKKAQIYFVYDADGSLASKKLAKFVESKNIGVVGKSKKVNGINIIIADLIDNM